MLLIHNHHHLFRRPKYFFPELKKAVLYSEILDKHFTFICTGRTLALVDEHHGLDGYILSEWL
mgnify:CR=1 FL=1